MLKACPKTIRVSCLSCMPCSNISPHGKEHALSDLHPCSNMCPNIIAKWCLLTWSCPQECPDSSKNLYSLELLMFGHHYSCWDTNLNIDHAYLHVHTTHKTCTRSLKSLMFGQLCQCLDISCNTCLLEKYSPYSM